ncbi:MAG: hypothetical protein HC880_20125 [Bacteroidia bacterium]|nr:hypothetical protein [Bacteroidia bacterium]
MNPIRLDTEAAGLLIRNREITPHSSLSKINPNIALRKAMRIARIGGWSLDPDTQMIEISSELRQILNVPQLKFPTHWQEYLKFVHPEDVAPLQNTVRQALENLELLRIEHRLLGPGHLVQHLLLAAAPYPKPNQDGYLLTGILQDISEQKNREQAEVLARQKAEQLAQAKTNFLSTMSHEIRTPMNAVVGITDLLLEEKLAPEQWEKIQTLKFSAENLLAIIDEVLDYSKVEAGKIEMDHKEFSLYGICRHIKQSLEPRTESKGIKLKLLWDENIPPFLIGDPTRLLQILNNLVGNAIKFTQEGSIRLRVWLDEETDEEAVVHFSVQDTGIGISEEHQSRIFDSFTQLGSDNTDNLGGTGLGLAITKRLVELMGSQIHLRSEPGQGSEFSFSIRYAKTNSQETEVFRGPQIQTQFDLSGVRILIAEDNPINQFVVQNYLKENGR